MTMFLGMDVEQAQEHTVLLDERAGRLEDLGAALTLAAATVPWTGPDADAFRTASEQILARLASAGARLHRDAQHLREQAGQQEEASSPDGEGATRRASSAFYRGLPTAPYDDPDDDIAAIGLEDMTRPPASELVEPHSIEELIDNLNIANEQQTAEATSIRVQAIVGEDGVMRYVVYVPGSFGDDPLNVVNPQDTGANPNDWNQNGGALAGQDTDSRQALIAAMEAAGIPHGADVVLAGHSQGGIVSSNLAADPVYNGGAGGWNITDVVTIGSPVENAPVPAGTNTLNVSHIGAGIPFTDSFRPGDLVPALDGNPSWQMGTPPSDHRDEVLLPAPAPGGIFENHGIDHYRDSIAGAEGHAGEVIEDFEGSESMQNILGPGAQTIDTVDVSVSRVEGSYGDGGISDLWDPEYVMM